MFNMQTLYALCPKGGAVSYQIDLSLQNLSPHQTVRVTFPDGMARSLPPTDGAVRIEHTDTPGVWRYVAELLPADNGNPVLDSFIIEAVIIEDTDEKLRRAVAEVIGQLKKALTSNRWEGEKGASAAALGLYRDLRGMEISELLRLLCFDRSVSSGDFCPRLLLLREGLSRPEARAYLPVIIAIAADLLCTQKDRDITSFEFDIMVRAALPPKHKWVYFLQVFSSMNPATPIHGLGENALRAVARELVKATPPDFRNLVIDAAENRLELDPPVGIAAGQIFLGFNHREGVPKLLTASELDPTLLPDVCSVLKAMNCRETIGSLRALLQTYYSVSGGDDLITLLSEWKDAESIPTIVQKLKSEFNLNSIHILMDGLKNFGDKALAVQAEEIAAVSPDQKAAIIRNKLQGWS